MLPFTFIVSYPTAFVFEGPSPTLLLHATCIVAGAFLLMLALWRLALRAYVSASS